MKNLQELLDKLSKVVYTTTDLNSISGVIDGNTIKVSYETKLSESLHTIKSLPVQIVIRVKVNGVHATTWGCENNADHTMFAKWFATQNCIAFKNEFNNESVAKDEAQELFNSL